MTFKILDFLLDMTIVISFKGKPLMFLQDDTLLIPPLPSTGCGP